MHLQGVDTKQARKGGVCITHGARRNNELRGVYQSSPEERSLCHALSNGDVMLQKGGAC